MDFDNTMLPTRRTGRSSRSWTGSPGCRMQASRFASSPTAISSACRISRSNITFLRTHAAKPGTRHPGGHGRYGAAPQQTALVGDQIYTDVLGAKRAGITRVCDPFIITFWLKLRHLLELPFRHGAKRRRGKHDQSEKYRSLLHDGVQGLADLATAACMRRNLTSPRALPLSRAGRSLFHRQPLHRVRAEEPQGALRSWRSA